jgi:rsbT antagonist protein RsbS
MDRVPVLQFGSALLVSIQVDLQDDDVIALQEQLAERIVAATASGVVIDISAVEIVDSFIGRTFASIAALSRVLDAETVVVGMRPAVAITLVELGLLLEGVRTALDLEKGLAILSRSAARRGRFAEVGLPGDEEDEEIEEDGGPAAGRSASAP